MAGTVKGWTIRYPESGAGKYEATNAQGQTRAFRTLTQAERWIDNGAAQRNAGRPMLGRSKRSMYR